MASKEETSARSEDWASTATGFLDKFVVLVRDRATRPILFATRVAILVVFALIVTSLAIAVLLVGLIHLFDVVVFPGRVWATDFIFGGILGGSGLFLLRLSSRTRRSDAGR